VQIRHPDPQVAPFEFNSSLAKLGVKEKLAAEELIDQWAVQFLSGQSTSFEPKNFKTVEQAILDYLDEKRGTLDQKKESSKLTIRKIAGILKPLTAFLSDRGVVYMKDVKTEHLTAFQETWKGRLRKNRKTGELVLPTRETKNPGIPQDVFPAVARAALDRGESCRSATVHQDSEE